MKALIYGVTAMLVTEIICLFIIHQFNIKPEHGFFPAGWICGVVYAAVINYYDNKNKTNEKRMDNK